MVNGEGPKELEGGAWDRRLMQLTQPEREQLAEELNHAVAHLEALFQDFPQDPEWRTKHTDGSGQVWTWFGAHCGWAVAGSDR